MTPHDVKKVVGELPTMSLEQALRMTEFIHEHRIRDVLELGFFYGVSTTYIAAALEEGGGGSVVTIDQESARRMSPSIEDLLSRAGLKGMVTLHFEPTSYTWRLMKMLEEHQGPKFDLCYVDGAHTWFIDGFAFFLVDRLLRPGGWIIFDDLDWTFATSPALRDSDQVRQMPEEERETPQVRKVYELLVKTHPSFGEFMTDGNWAYARKIENVGRTPPLVRQEIVVVRPRGFWRKTISRLRRSISSSKP